MSAQVSDPKAAAEAPSMPLWLQFCIALAVVAVVALALSLAVRFGGKRSPLSTGTDTGTGQYPAGTPIPSHIERIDNAAALAPVTLYFQVVYSVPVIGSSLDLTNLGTADVTFGSPVFNASRFVTFSAMATTAGLVEPAIGSNNDVRAAGQGHLPAPDEPFEDPTLGAVQVYPAGTPLPLRITRTDNNPTTPGVSMSFVIEWSQPVNATTVALVHTGTATGVSISYPVTTLAETAFDVTVMGTGTVLIELDAHASVVHAQTGGIALPARADAAADLVTVEHMPPFPQALLRTDSNPLEPGVTLTYDLVWTEAVDVTSLVIDNTLGTAGTPLISNMVTMDNTTTFDATIPSAGTVQLRMPAASSIVASSFSQEPMPNSATIVADELTVPAHPPELLSLQRLTADSYGWVGQRLDLRLTFDTPVIINSLNWSVGGTAAIAFEAPIATGPAQDTFDVRAVVTGPGTSIIEIVAGSDVEAIVGGTPIDPAHDAATTGYSETFAVPASATAADTVGDESPSYTPTGPFAACVPKPFTTQEGWLFAQTGDAKLAIWQAPTLAAPAWALTELANADDNSSSQGLLLIGNGEVVAFASSASGPVLDNKYTHTPDAGANWDPLASYAPQSGYAITRHGNGSTRALFEITAASVALGNNATPLAGGSWSVFTGAVLPLGSDYLTYLDDPGSASTVHVVGQSSVSPYPLLLYTSVNGGATWGIPTTVWAGNGVDRVSAACFCDYELYVCWTDSTHASSPGVYFTRWTTMTTFAPAAQVTGVGPALPATANLKLRMLAMSLPVITLTDAANKTVHAAVMLNVDDSAPTTSFAWNLFSRSFAGSGNIETGEPAAMYQRLVMPVRQADGGVTTMYTSFIE